MQLLFRPEFNQKLNAFNITSEEYAYLKADPEWMLTGMCSPYNRLYLVTEGSGSVRYPQRSFRLLPGHAYLLPANISYDFSCEKHMEKLYHHFNILLPDGRDLFSPLEECLQLPFPVEQIRELAGADSLGFLSLEGLHRLAPDAQCGFCEGCFTGRYPVAVN